MDAVSELIINKYKTEFEIVGISNWNSKSQIHKLSHQHLNINFWKVKVKGEIPGATNGTNIKKFPFPKVIFNFIEGEYSELS